ncbi:MAG: hypothetical protein WDN30_10610 [Pararobbsia sp.]
MLSAFQNVADTLVSLDEDANTLSQTHRSMRAAQATTSDHRGALQARRDTVLCDVDGGPAVSERARPIRARACGTACDTAALFDSMGDPPLDHEGKSLRETVAPKQAANTSSPASPAGQ